MRRYLIPVVAVVAAIALPAAARDGVDVWIEVYDDLGACATITSYGPGPVAGSFASGGVVTGPGTIVEPVRGATPFTITGPDTWYGCLPDAYAGATTGDARYVVAYSTRTHDRLVVVRCTVTSGVVSCG